MESYQKLLKMIQNQTDSDFTEYLLRLEKMFTCDKEYDLTSRDVRKAARSFYMRITKYANRAAKWNKTDVVLYCDGAPTDPPQDEELLTRLCALKLLSERYCSKATGLIDDIKNQGNIPKRIIDEARLLLPESNVRTPEAQPEVENTDVSTVESTATLKDICQTVKAIERRQGDERLEMFRLTPPAGWKNIKIGFDSENRGFFIKGKSFTYKELGLPKLPINNPECSTTGLFIKILFKPDRKDNSNERRKISELNKNLKSLTGLSENPITGNGDTYLFKFIIDNETNDRLKDDHKERPYDDDIGIDQDY